MTTCNNYQHLSIDGDGDGDGGSKRVNSKWLVVFKSQSRLVKPFAIKGER